MAGGTEIETGDTREKGKRASPVKLAIPLNHVPLFVRHKIEKGSP
jgi:hypothetical protein